MPKNTSVHSIFIALGSNLGSRLDYLTAARLALSPQVRVLACSSIYSTPPWGLPDQPDYLNQVVQAETHLAPQALLAYLKAIETQQGRTATLRYGPRIIDLDILFFDDLVLNSTALTIPHPRLSERAFVLVPLAEIAPDLIHPVSHLTVKTLLEAVDLQGIHQLHPVGADPCSDPSI